MNAINKQGGDAMLSIKKFCFDKEFSKIVLAIAIPLMLQQLITCSVNLIDNLMVGQLGDIAVGGVAAVNRFYIIATYGTNGLINAAAIFIAQFYGARNHEKMQQTFRFMLVSAVAIIMVFLVIGTLIPDVVVGFFTHDPQIIALGADYMQIAAFSFLPMALTLCIASSMRSIGETKLPLIASAVAVITNTSLNYCLIFGNFGFPRLGVSGAAVATLIARCLELAIILYFLKINDFEFKTSLVKVLDIPKEVASKVIAKGLPLAANEILWSMGMAALFKFYATRGTDVMSGYSICTTIGDIFFVLYAGMAAASTVLISQPFGANDLEKGRSNAYKLLGFCFCLSFVFAVLMYGSTFIIPQLYANVSANARMVATNFLRVQSVLFWVYMFTTECYFILRSGGDTKNTLIMDSCFMWLVNIPLVGIFTYFTSIGYLGLYLVGQATDLLKLVFAYHLITKEKWVKNLTHHDS